MATAVRTSAVRSVISKSSRSTAAVPSTVAVLAGGAVTSQSSKASYLSHKGTRANIAHCSLSSTSAAAGVSVASPSSLCSFPTRTTIMQQQQQQQQQQQRGSSVVCGGHMSDLGRSAPPTNREQEKLMGARDPTAGEIHSDFGINVQGHADTEHVIKPPESIGDIVGLKNRKCVPCEGGKGIVALTEEEADRLRMQAGPGWQIVKLPFKSNPHKANSTDDAPTEVLSLKTDIVVKNFVSGLELFKRIGEVAEEEGHHPDLHLESWNKASIVLSTHSVGGLTENDFIMAAKINDLDISDLKRKKKQKFWA